MKQNESVSRTDLVTAYDIGDGWKGPLIGLNGELLRLGNEFNVNFPFDIFESINFLEKKVLDLGSSTGYHCIRSFYNGASYTHGLEKNQSNFEIARLAQTYHSIPKNKLDFTLADFSNYDFSDISGQFDLVLHLGTIGKTLFGSGNLFTRLDTLVRIPKEALLFSCTNLYAASELERKGIDLAFLKETYGDSSVDIEKSQFSFLNAILNFCRMAELQFEVLQSKTSHFFIKISAPNFSKKT